MLVPGCNTEKKQVGGETDLFGLQVKALIRGSQGRIEAEILAKQSVLLPWSAQLPFLYRAGRPICLGMVLPAVAWAILH